MIEAIEGLGEVELNAGPPARCRPTSTTPATTCSSPTTGRGRGVRPARRRPGEVDRALTAGPRPWTPRAATSTGDAGVALDGRRSSTRRPGARPTGQREDGRPARRPAARASAASPCRCARPAGRRRRPRSSPSAAPALVDGFDSTALSVLAPDIQASLGASDAVMGAIAGAVRRAVPARLDPDQLAGRPLPPQGHRRRVDGAVVGRRVRHRRWSRTPSGCSWPGWAPGSASPTRCRSTARC